MCFSNCYLKNGKNAAKASLFLFLAQILSVAAVKQSVIPHSGYRLNAASTPYGQLCISSGSQSRDLGRHLKPCLFALAEQASFAGASDPNAGSMAAVPDLPPANCPPVADPTSKASAFSADSPVGCRGTSRRAMLGATCHALWRHRPYGRFEALRPQLGAAFSR